MRTLFLILLALCLAAAVWAQPWGPYEIAVTSDSVQNLHSPQIAIIDSQTARVFYTLDVPGYSEIRTALYDLVNHQIIGTIETASTDTVSRTLLDAAADGMNNWVVIYERRRNVYWVETNLLIGSTGSARVVHIGFTGQTSEPYFLADAVTDYDLVPRIGGGWLLTWIQQTVFGPYYENSNQIYVAGLIGDSMEYRQPLLPYENQLFGPYYAAALSVTPDCSLVLTDGIWDPYVDIATMLMRAVAGADSEVLDTVCSYNCDFSVLSFHRASDGSLLAYSDPNTLLQVNETRECTVLGSLSPSGAPADIDFRAGYGFASIWTNPSWIKLGRMHEDGTMIEPGVFYWRDMEHAIRSASVAIAPDGRIYVVWTEGSSTETRLMIARINWDTPLDASDRDLTTHPSSFILSAIPNPFNSTLKIEYMLPNTQDVNLSVFNVLGQKVKTLVEARIESGSHAVAWNPMCAGGVYFVTLKTATGFKATKVLYIR